MKYRLKKSYLSNVSAQAVKTLNLSFLASISTSLTSLVRGGDCFVESPSQKKMLVHTGIDGNGAIVPKSLMRVLYNCATYSINLTLWSFPKVRLVDPLCRSSNSIGFLDFPHLSSQTPSGIVHIVHCVIMYTLNGKLPYFNFLVSLSTKEIKLGMVKPQSKIRQKKAAFEH